MTQENIHNDSTRHIHNTLGGSKEFIRGFTLRDIALLFTPALVILIPIGLPFLPEAITLPLLGLSAASVPIMLLFHKTKPEHLTLYEFLSSKIKWHIKKKQYKLGTQSLDDSLYTTQIDEVRENSIRRTDGALIGAVKIDPANMALKTDSSWSQAVNSFANYANSTFEFKTQIYITGEEISADDHTGSLRSRVQSPEMQKRTILKQILTDYIGWYETRINQQGAHTREYYVIVPVTDEEIDAHSEAETSVVDTLSRFPVIGRAFSKLQTRQDGMTDAQREKLKQRKLDARLTEIRTGANSLYGCSGSQIDTYEFAKIIKEYWSCTPEDYADIPSALGSLPVTITDDDVTTTANGRGVTGKARKRVKHATNAELEEYLGDDTDEDKQDIIETAQAHDVLTDIGKKHKSFFAPSTIDWETSYGVIDGDKYVRTYWIENFPEYPSDGFLERVLLEADLGTDISIHLDPFDTQSAMEALTDWISSLQVTHRELEEAGEIRSEDIQQDINRAKDIRSTVRSNQTSLFRGGVYLRVVADDKDQLRKRSRELESILKDVPANCTPKVATRWQEKGLVTASPIGKNELGKNQMSTMTGSSVGAMFPFSSNYYMDNDGIEYGIHGHNGSPVIIDPFDLDTGFNELIAGDIGSGKTFNLKKNIIRTLQSRDDVKVVMLDPVQEFRGLIDAFGGERVVVGGQTKLNPLHIEKTPQHVLDKADGDLDPFAAKKDEVMGFLDNFFEMEGIELGDRRGVLRYAIGEVYADAGITSNVQTHTRPSPTLQDLIDVLVDIANSPENHDIVSSASGYETVAQYANALEMSLQPFKEDGTHSNLAQGDTVDVLSTDENNQLVYIDLQQEDGRGESNKSFMMQLLLSTVYQQAKNTDKKVMFCIDEAHYLLENRKNLGYIQQTIRHSRHVGMRMILASQTIEEFYANEDTRTIANQCSIKVLHKLTGLTPELSDELGLTADQQEFVQSAAAGDEDLGYSEALVQIKEVGEYPLQIHSHELETELIEHGMDGPTLLKQLADDDEEKEQFRDFLQKEGAVRTLFEYYGLSQEKAQELVEEGVEYDKLVDSLINLVEGVPEDQSGLEDWVDTSTESGSSDKGSSEEAMDDAALAEDGDVHWTELDDWNEK